MTLQFGIIGNPLEHSFSAPYFNEKFAREGIDARYEAYPIQQVEEFVGLCQMHDFIGLNVTYPYKESIIPYLDALDETAAAIGAVNVIRFVDGKKIGYNTDVIGFMEALQPLLQPQHTSALILGTGGAAKAITYALKKLGIGYRFVSRDASRGLSYESLTKDTIRTNKLIINCTPLGMYPNIETYPAIPYEHLTAEHLLYDVVYNPAKSVFLQKGEERGARTHNGLEMLHGQACAAWEIWQKG